MAKDTGKNKKETKSKKKAAEAEQEGVETVSATARFVRISPRKLRLVADLVRGKKISDAKVVLSFTPRGGAKVIGKVISSAVANAENNHDMSEDDLFVSSIYVNEGPTIKRWRARAMGRAGRINKRTSHVTVKLSAGKEG